MTKRNTQQVARTQVADAVSTMIGTAPALRLDVNVPTLAAESGNIYPPALPIVDTLAYTLGAECAARDWASAEAFMLCRDALCNKDYATCAAFRDEWKHGASDRGYVNVDALWSKHVAVPLKSVYDWTMPKSPASSAQRPKSAEAQAKADKAKAEKEALDAMTTAEIKAEIKAKGTSSERKATLYKALTTKENDEAKAKGKEEKESRKTMTKAIADALDAMTVGQVRHILTECNKMLAAGK